MEKWAGRTPTFPFTREHRKTPAAGARLKRRPPTDTRRYIGDTNAIRETSQSLGEGAVGEEATATKAPHTAAWRVHGGATH